MNEILQYVAESILCSGTLYLLYRVVLEGKIAFRWARCYLLGALLLGTVIPLLHIPVWPAEVVWVEPTTELGIQQVALGGEVQTSTSLSSEAILLTLYAIGTLLMAIATLRQLLLIRSLRRGSERAECAGYNLYRTQRQIIPFSFWRSIYVGKNAPEEAMPAIIAHELSHLRHRHTLERFAAEALKMVMWWNPFLWLTVRSLTEVEEYEADRDVLASGIEPSYYMTTLFEQLFGISPDIANGLPHSLTKKRFKMMTQKSRSSHLLLRATAVAATVAGLFCAFSLTAQATQYRTTDQQPTDSTSFEAQLKKEAHADLDAIRVTAFTDAPQKTPPVAHQSPAKQEEIPLTAAEQKPSFQGGDLNHFMTWISTQVQPQTDEHGVQLTGMVMVEFVIDRDGSLCDVKTLKSDNERLSREVERVMKSSPRWEAGMHQGEKVRVKYVLPVLFAKASVDKAGNVSEEPTAEPFFLVKSEPTFDGGDLNTFRRWVMTQVRYPKGAAEKKIAGRVICTFTIDEQGKLINPKILQTPDASLGEEVLRVIKQSPDKWAAGEERGKPIAVNFTLPIDFALD